MLHQHERSNWWRRLVLRFCAILAGIAGIGSGSPAACGSPAYGVEIPAPPEGELEIVSLEYSPASPFHVGDTLTFTATTTRASRLAKVWAFFYVGGGHWGFVRLLDDGASPDAVSGDGIWTGVADWHKAWGMPQYGEVDSKLTWSNGSYDFGPGALRITVLPMED